MSYHPLNTNIPVNPPNYQDIDTSTIQQFEIDDGIQEQQQPLLTRATLFSQRISYNFHSRIITPVAKLIDPICEGYKYFQIQYEKSILRLGNPLVVKRLLYVAFILLILFMISKYNTNDTIKGTSGGTFTNGKFYDVDMLEDSIQSLIDPKLMKENLEYVSSFTHITGTKGDLALAKYIEKYMSNNGINSIEFNELSSFINYPSQETYVKLADGSFVANLREGDQLSYNPNSLNSNEKIEENYLYVNYGELKDFKLLQDNKIDVTDKILLIKYGGNTPESTKLYHAYTNHAKAVIFITPKFKTGDEIQRINVGNTRMAFGDVLTPGWASEDGYVTRINWDKSESTPKIPSIPISYNDGHKLLSYLRDGIKFDNTYSGTGNSIKLQLKINNINRPVHPIWNIIGSIEGREQNEKGVIIGATRDSSCFGTISNTGTVALLEMIKIFTSLQRKHQWSPTRSLYFISFDATEYNLAGSSEWIENKKEFLKKMGYLYIDLSDLIAGDELQINAHPFLHEVINGRLKKVLTTTTKGDSKLLSLYDLFIKQGGKLTNNFIEYKNYIPFINSVNIPSLEIKFTGKSYPKNSCLDNFQYFQDNKIDNLMEKHSQLIELISRITLQFIESPLIPYNFNDFVKFLDIYITDLQEYSKDIISKLDQPNNPNLHFTNLQQATELMKRIANGYQDWSNNWKTFVRESRGLEPSLYALARRQWNDRMLEFNDKFLVKKIHPTRPGYSNILFGIPFNVPNVPDQYEWNTFPRIRQLLNDHEFGHAQQEIDNLANVLYYAAKDYSDL